MAALLLAGCAPRLGDVFIVGDAGLPCTFQVIDGGGACSVPSEFLNDFGTVSARVEQAEDGTIVTTLPICSTSHRVSLQLYPGRGVFAGGGVAAGDFALAGDDLAFDTCGACVRFFGDVDAQVEPRTVYMATGGTLHITQFGRKFAASLENVDFEEVTIDPITFETKPVIGGCVTRITGINVLEPVSPLR